MPFDYQGFVFDLDGTILSTIEDIADAVNYSLQKNGLPTRKEEEFPAFLGNGSVKLIQRAMGHERPELFASVFETYYRYYQERYCVRTHPFPGIVEVLKKAKEKGILLFVDTNKPEDIARCVVEKCFGKSFFDEIVGIPLGGKVKPDPEAFVEKVLVPYRLDPTRLAYFGDSVTDVVTARNLRIREIYAVSWGYCSRQALADSRPTRILDRVEEIEALFNPKD